MRKTPDHPPARPGGQGGMLPADYPAFLTEVKARIAAAWTRAAPLPYVLTTSN